MSGKAKGDVVWVAPCALNSTHARAPPACARRRRRVHMKGHDAEQQQGQQAGTQLRQPVAEQSLAAGSASPALQDLQQPATQQSTSRTGL